MDQETAEKVEEKLEQAAGKADIELDQVIMFGSRARDDYRERSDVDLIIVSKNFEDISWHKRPKQFYLEWDYDELPTPEFICLTPEEFEERRQKTGNIVKTAAETGVRLA